MNIIQTKTINHLSSGRGTTVKRARALGELAKRDFFDPAATETESAAAINAYITDMGDYACADGIRRFRDAVGVPEPTRLKTLRVLVDGCLRP